MCASCDGFTETIIIKQPYEYFHYVNEVRAAINQGTLVLIDGNCNLDRIAYGKPWPNDYIYHIFKCPNCSVKFILCVETYHGSGGHWKVLED